jgi:hypothetical protein
VTAAPAIGLLPDAEQVASAFLRRAPRVAALVGDRVYTAFPAQAGGAPLVLVQRVGGEPPFSYPLVADAAQLQLSTYGGGKKEAHTLAATVRACLHELAGTVQPEGTVAGVTFGFFQYLPDETYRPARPRYVFDVTITTRAAPVSAGAV